jgi:CRP-like cAMP-binding protein
MRKQAAASPLTPAAGLIEPEGLPTSFPRDATIYREGGRADRLYKIVTGTVRTHKILLDGRRQIGSFYLAGDTFGLEGGDQHAFSAEAVTDTELRVIKLSEWEKELVLALMGRELQHAQDHQLLLAKTARERVASFLLEMSDRIRSTDEVELPMSRQDIADYVGLTTETVSRTLTELEHQSAIALTTSKLIALRNRATLSRLRA